MTRFTTPDLCDEFPEQVSVAESGFRNFGGVNAFHGQVVTLKCFEDNSLVREWVGQPGEGRVLVVDGGGSMRRAMLGDMLAERAVENGWAGIIIYGCIRDVDIIADLSLGVQALGCHPMKTDKKGVGESNLVVSFHGVDFAPGGYVYADNNGILFSQERLI
ncbi:MULTISPECIES: ribonuclease E activity regulator RraA [unclassified Endozoicomonas]|uniref:ribonuclease E activity regulator RraA n=1 Tax=unclassified Endozoicomonas TaxID=2644528 RepID=UPI002149211C|nr:MULTISPECIES: ribonuclease E activity regulator RraA [unclassified Endozoicomonas]